MQLVGQNPKKAILRCEIGRFSCLSHEWGELHRCPPMVAWPGRALLSARALRPSLAAEAERRNMDRRDRSPDIAAMGRMVWDEAMSRGLGGLIVPRADGH